METNRNMGEPAPQDESGEPVADLEFSTTGQSAVKRSQKAPGCWLSSPAVLTFFVLAYQWLSELAIQRQTNLGSFSKVTKIRAVRRKGETNIYLFPVDWDDPNGLPVKKTDSHTSVNLYDFMAKASLLVDVNRAMRFDLQIAGSDSPVGPALVFDRAKPVEQKVLPKRQKKSAAAKTKTNSKTQTEAKTESVTVPADKAEPAAKPAVEAAKEQPGA